MLKDQGQGKPGASRQKELLSGQVKEEAKVTVPVSRSTHGRPCTGHQRAQTNLQVKWISAGEIDQ